ncbi:hypothetical protein B0F90DRAFT_1814604 [Multifurca ochricompacta]|uniref:Cytochrome b561 domain-containing protein n=1 Tax=Multifurca ochricompacta TaxID=376703 RepID=A0AAD4QSD5_9AGAM|nr:hypothetical protein B0F90DRAFT_1814604 [Multifurca ochricompacta]
MGSNEQQTKGETRSGDNLAFNIALVSALILLLSTWTIILSNNPNNLSWFAFHPTLNTLALFCFTFGILTLQPTSQPKTKAAGLQRHQFAMGFGFIFILLGTSAIWYNKTSHRAPHYTTWHGTFGLITVSWLVFQVALGAGSVWFGGAAFGGGHKAKLVWKYHRLSGYILLPLLLTTVNFGGAWSAWVSENSAYIVRLVAYTFAPLGILASLYSRTR